MNGLVSILNLLAIVACARWIGSRQKSVLRPLFWPALILKLAAGIALGLIYQDYYLTGDTFFLFDQAKHQTQLFTDRPGDYLNFLWTDHPGEWKGHARSMFLVKIISVVNIFTLSNYWVTSLWLSFISFLAAWYCATVVVRSFPDSLFAAALAFLFFPSIVFWSSGIIKESLGLGALLILSGFYLNVMTAQKFSGVEAVLAVIAAWILWNLKYYWAAVFLPITVASFTIQYCSARWVAFSRFRVIGWLVLFFLLCVILGLGHPNFYPDNFLRVVIENNAAFVSISDPSNLIHYHNLEASWWSVLINSPWALVSGLFRPFAWEAGNLWKALVSFENVIVLVLFLSSLTRAKDVFRSEHKLLSFSVIGYIGLLCVFLALSTPNLGSLTRYKVGFMPFLIFLVTYKNPLVDSVLWPTMEKLKSW